MTPEQFVGFAIGTLILVGAVAALVWFAYKCGEHRGYMRGMDQIAGTFRGKK
jgi:hypothetical protein